MRDYFKENVEYEQLEKESEFTERENNINELKLSLSDLLVDVELFEILYEYDYINLEQYNLLKETLDFEIKIKEK